MNNYDFAELLSPTRFEQLSRDLLQSEYGNFENFAEGRDNGIDFRYSVNEKNYTLIVQCKRYKKHNYPSLKSSLKKEVNKIKKKNISDYLLVTSVDLSPPNKTEIVNIFQGIIKNENQIITRGDLNFRLGQKQNEYIEFKYPELWMNSINVQQKIFKLGFLKHSEFIRSKIEKTLITFVEHEVYQNVLNHIKKENSVIISGIPGIGKTTLSYAVIAYFIKFQNFRFIDVSYRHIEKAEGFLYDSSPTIFFLDDFLGRTKLDKKEGEANLIFEFIEKVRNSNEHKLIISTREYILKKAESEFYSVKEFKNFIDKYVIELRSLTRKTRVQIFYNHLKNCDLPFNFIQTLLKNDYLFLIDHRNYSPRIIEHLTSKSFLKGINSKDYFHFFISNLNDSSKVWEHAFHNLPNDIYKVILFYLFLMDLPTTYESIELTINSLIQNDKNFQHFELDSFEIAIKELEGTFISLIEDYDDLLEERISSVDFYNPSVKDFIESLLWDKRHWLEILIKNAKYTEQLFNYDAIEHITNDDKLTKMLVEKTIKDFNNLRNSGYRLEESSYEDVVFDIYKGTKNLAHLERLSSRINPEEYPNFRLFLSKQIFKFDIDITNSIDERGAMITIAEDLIPFGLISPKEVIDNYCNQTFTNRKEVVILEYFTRNYPEMKKYILQNKRLNYVFDEVFLQMLEDEDDLFVLSDFEYRDDYHQIKNKLAPLIETTKRLNYIDENGLYDRYIQKIKEKDNEEFTKVPKALTKDENEIKVYRDIEDEKIKILFDKLLSEHDTKKL